MKERRREKGREEEEEERYGILVWKYGNHGFVWNSKNLYGIV